MDKVKIPKFVADYIKKIKTDGDNNIVPKWGISGYFTDCVVLGGLPKYIKDWINKNKNYRLNLIIKAIMNGYQIKESKYVIKLKDIKDDGNVDVYLSYNNMGRNGWTVTTDKQFTTQFSEEQINAFPEWIQNLAVEVDE